MASLKITSKGQVTFKKDLLSHLKSKPGDRLEVTALPGGRLEVKAAPSGSLDDFIGILAGKTDKTASLEELDQAAQQGWAGKVS